jgi:hypothetical protein
MFVVQISLLIVTLLSLISWILLLLQTAKALQRSQPTPSHCVMCQYVDSVSSCSCLVLLFLMLLVECWCMLCYITREGQVEWTTPHHTIIMLHFVLFHRVTCYTNSLVSRIHVNTTKLHNITCTLVATGVILRSLECSVFWDEKSLKEGQNHTVWSFFEKLSIKSSLVCHVLEPILKVGWYFWDLLFPSLKLWEIFIRWLDSSYHVRTNASVRRGIFWGTSIQCHS